MADPLSFFGIPPTRPERSVFGLPFTPDVPIHVRAAAADRRMQRDLEMGAANSQMNRWEQEQEALELQALADEQASAALPYLQKLDPTAPDYYEKRALIESNAPLAGLNPIVQQFLGVQERVNKIQQARTLQQQKLAEPAIELEYDLLEAGVPRSEMETFRGKDGYLDMRRGMAKLGEAKRKNKGSTASTKTPEAEEMTLLQRVLPTLDSTDPRYDAMSARYQELAEAELARIRGQTKPDASAAKSEASKKLSSLLSD